MGFYPLKTFLNILNFKLVNNIIVGSSFILYIVMKKQNILTFNRSISLILLIYFLYKTINKILKKITIQ